MAYTVFHIMQGEDTDVGMQWRERIIDAFSQKVYDLVIPKDHFLRRVNQEVDFAFVNPLCESRYKQGKAGRRAEAPERLFRALLIMIFYAIPFETTLTQEIGLNLAYRWFCGIGIGEPIFLRSFVVLCFAQTLGRKLVWGNFGADY